MQTTPRHTDEQISAAVQHFIEVNDFDASDPPMMKAVESFAADAGLNLKRVCYQFKVRGISIGASAPLASPPAGPPVITLADRAAEYAARVWPSIARRGASDPLSYDDLQRGKAETGLSVGLLQTAFLKAMKS